MGRWRLNGAAPQHRILARWPFPLRMSVGTTLARERRCHDGHPPPWLAGRRTGRLRVGPLVTRPAALFTDLYEHHGSQAEVERHEIYASR
jgi:hypothetical protein